MKKESFLNRKTKHNLQKIYSLVLLSFFLVSCNEKGLVYDASGYFETIETVVSAQGNGELIRFDVQEGQKLTAGQKVGQIDSTQIYLTLQQVRAQKGAVLSRKPDISSQTAILKEQIAMARREYQRVQNLYKGDAATQKQLEDAKSQVDILNKQLEAQKIALSQSSSSIAKESNPLGVQAAILQDQLEKSRIINPISGTVLVKYVEQNELVVAGKPLYKIANMSNMILRSYVTNSQLSKITIGQKVTVVVETGDEDPKTYAGIVSWISEKAEFTPKTIQTKDERSNAVYAIKITVPNDGYLRIGMYAEVKFK